jgi:hypothetical protein
MIGTYCMCTLLKVYKIVGSALYLCCFREITVLTSY